MSSIFEIASKVSTPLALAGVAVAVLFIIFKLLIKKNIFPKLTVALSGEVILKIINYVFIIAVIAIAFGFAGYVIDKFIPASPSDYIKVSLPSKMSFKNAVKTIVANDGHTVVFSNCTEMLLDAKIEPGEFGGKTSKDLIEALQYRLINSGKVGKYSVEYFQDRGIYEIKCN